MLTPDTSDGLSMLHCRRYAQYWQQTHYSILGKKWVQHVCVLLHYCSLNTAPTTTHMSP